MFISKPNKGYSAASNLTDPDTTVSQRWHGNGFRFRNLNGNKLEPVLAVRNTGDQTSHVKGKILFTRPNGNTDSKNIPEKNVGPGNTKFIDLEDLIDDIPNAVQYGGIELEYDTPKGTIITSLQSVSQNGEHVFQVPMFDPSAMPSSAGGFPWKANGDYTTLVYIKNETNVARKYVAYLNYDGGQYSVGIKELRPGETVAVDFRALRDNATPDILGNTIPSEVDKGQIGWSAHGSMENKVLSGRSEQISLADGIASTYACYNCCQNRYYDSWIDPGGTETTVGDFSTFQARQRDISCNDTVTPPYIVYSSVNWEISEPSVASLDSAGEAESLSPGTATVQASWTADDWVTEVGYEECNYTTIPVSNQATMEVVSVQKIQYKVNAVWTDVPSGGIGPFCNATSVDFRAVPTSGSFPSGQPTWGGDASGTGVEKTVNFSTAGSRTVSATSGNTVSVTINVNADNANINVTWLSPNITTDSADDNATTTPIDFVPEYTACAELVTNEWRLRVKKVEGGTSIVIHTGGYRNPSTSPPVSQTEAIAANTVMNAYYNNGKGSWHTSGASQAHENHHNAEWTCTGNHYWGPTETAVETLRASYTTYNTEAAAITQMRTTSGGANAKMTAFRSVSDTYFASLSDVPGSRPYAAGQLVLNGEITTIIALAATSGWTGVPGVANASPNATPPCYQTFGTYNP